MKFDAKAIGLRVRELRKERGITQEELAKYLGMSVKHIGGFERADTGISIPNYIKLANYFGVTLDYLICGKMDKRNLALMEKYAERLKKLSETEYSEFDKIMEIVLKGLSK